MKTQDIKNMASAYMQVQEKSKMDKVDPKALKKDFDDREDKDIDNDGDTDASDEYLHNRRKAVKKAMNKEQYGPGHIGAIQKMLDKEREAKKAKDTMNKEEADLDENKALMKDYQAMKAQGKKDHNIIDALMSMSKYKRMTRDQMAKTIGDAKRKGIFREEAELDEAPMRKRAPKMKGDFLKKERERNRAHDAAMGRTPTGRKKPQRAMTSTQRSLASMREALSKSQQRALQSIKAQPKSKVSLAKAPWDKKKEEKMNESNWPVYTRIKENRAMHTKGATEPEAIDSKASGMEKDFVNKHGGLKGVDSGIDGAKAAADTAKNATAGVKAGGNVNRPADQKTGDKNIVKSTEAK